MIYTKTDIIHQLTALGGEQNGVTIVHTSLRSVGSLDGGGKALLDALIEYFTAEGGLLCIPTHTWANLGVEGKITLDMTAPESNLGALASIALADGRGLLTENPTHSMVIFGDRKRAERFVENEGRVKTPTAPEGAYARLFFESGDVLLIGVSQNKNTYLHAVAELIGIKNRMSDERLSVTVKKPSGEIEEREFYLYDEDYAGDISYRFPKYDTAFRYHRAICDGFVGDAPTMLCDAVKMKETVELIFKNSGGVDPLGSEAPIPPSWYCNK